jgi:hypothetical protein
MRRVVLGRIVVMKGSDGDGDGDGRMTVRFMIPRQ